MIKSKFYLLWVRIQMAYFVLFGKKRHMILLRMNSEQFKHMLQDGQADVTVSYLHLQHYNVLQTIKLLASGIDFVDEAEIKADYQADLDEYLSRKN